MALRVIALSCLVFLLSLISFAAMATSEMCQYLARVKTSGRNSAGTDAIISLKLKSSSGSSFTVNNLQDWGIMDSGHDYFEIGNLDMFTGRGPCLTVCAITVNSNGAGHKPGWFLDYVEINTFGCDESAKVTFPVYQWVPKSVDVDLCSRFLRSRPALSSV